MSDDTIGALTPEEYARLLRYQDIAQFVGLHETDTEADILGATARYLVDESHMGDCARIYTVMSDDSFIRLAAQAGVPEPPRELRELSKGSMQTAVGRCVSQLHSQLIRDCSGSPSVARMPSEPSTGSVVCTNLSRVGECLGAVWLYHSSPGTFGPADQEQVETLSALVASLVAGIRARQRAEHLATHDFKTGLLNESGIRKHVAGIQAEPGSGHALIWIDIDNFKRYNNEGYQEVGDRIIREVGHLLDGWWSARGWVARWGGDEFVAVLSVSKDELSQLCIDALRGLRQIPGRDPVSVSIGADWWEGGSFNQTLIRVEAAHKVAKEAGKARFVRYSPDMRKRNIPLYKRVLRRLV